MKISVVIPAYNEQRLLGETLTRVREAMQSFERCRWDTELIVCDNNSTDRTAEIAKAAGAIVVFEPINQIARARNSGAAAATGDWIIFVDADSHPSTGLFADVAGEIASGTCMAGGTTLRLDGDYLVARGITRLWNTISRAGNLFAGSFLFCELAAFRALGGFSQELFAGEEIELSKRLKQRAREMGKRIVILHRNPLVTSARKIHLYSRREHLVFLAKTVFRRGRTLGSREECHTWYDGRR
jgi:glycosyltransferase involved in cell wall biosynthesis